MKIITDHINYLRDNPEGCWFKRKLYGWGWTPATWQGWVCIVLYLVVLGILVLRLDETAQISELVRTFFVPLGVATAVLLGLTFWRGESPRWQWGLPKDENLRGDK